jgi:hypothetical protein
MNRLNSFHNSLTNLTQNFIKQKYPNNLAYEDLILIQEISGDITNDIKKNITEYISSYNNEISQRLDLEELVRLFKHSKFKSEFEQKINKFLIAVNNIILTEETDQTKQEMKEPYWKNADSSLGSENKMYRDTL